MFGNRGTVLWTVLILILSAPGALRAQQPGAPDTTDVAADTLPSLEDIEARLLGELGGADSTQAAGPPPVAPAAQTAGTLNPNLSLIADFLIDFSPEESTLEGGDRFQLREIEIGIQGSVDPYFRYDAFIAFRGEEVEIEEGYASTLGLPAGLNVKLGKMRLPLGKANLTHRPELNTVDYPLVLQSYFGEEGLASTGVWGSIIGSPLGFFQDLSVVAANGPTRHIDEEAVVEPVQDDKVDEENDPLWLAHLRNYWDLTDAANIEVGASWATDVVHEPERYRENFYGLNTIWRWKPLQQGLYRSAVLQGELIWRNRTDLGTDLGWFLFGQYQFTRRWFVAGQYDDVARTEDVEGDLRSIQAIVRFFPTEFSQLRLAYQRLEPELGDGVDRILFQTTFALGPHRPHPF